MICMNKGGERGKERKNDNEREKMFYSETVLQKGCIAGKSEQQLQYNISGSITKV